MRLFGLEISRVQKAGTPTLSGVDSRGGWWPIIREAVAGNWQSNVEVEIADVLTYGPVFSCVTTIARDIGKLRLRLMRDQDGILIPTESASFSPVLRRPNRYQTPGQFFQSWMIAKLIHGNAYVMKERDNRGVVRALYVLDPTRVRPMVADDGSIYYELQPDNLAGLTSAVTVTSDEIIHDRMGGLYHPLVGISPISACGVSAVLALRIQQNSAVFFGNGSQPGGIVSTDKSISQPTADRLKEYWDSAFSGSNAGKVAILGDGLKYSQMAVNADDSQLIDQLKWAAQDVCTAFNMPPYKINVGPAPTYNNIEALDLQYYEQCLQEHIESIENLLDFGLGLKPDKIDGVRYETQFDLSDLVRMDTAGRVSAASEAIKSGMSPNEVRRRYYDLPPVEGGDSPMLQQQQFSLEALAERDEDKPFSKPTAPDPAAPAAQVSEPEEDSTEDAEKALTTWRQIDMELRYAA